CGLVQQRLQGGEQLFLGLAVGGQPYVLALLVEGVDAPAVGDCVGCVRVLGIGALDLVGDAVAPGERRNGLFVARQADRMGIELIHVGLQDVGRVAVRIDAEDRKSTRLNSSHVK